MPEIATINPGIIDEADIPVGSLDWLFGGSIGVFSFQSAGSLVGMLS